MADLKTTQERRDRFRTWLHDDTRDHMSIRAWCVAEDACQDVDTLLAENAKLRAALAPFAAFAATLPPVGDEPRFTDSGALASGAVFADPAKPPLRFITYADVRRALAALEAP